MKKNKALTAAISVLSLTMVSMCAIGGTFAKYASQGSATDTATVAAWGIQLSVTGDEVLYDDDKTGNEVTGLKVNANTLAAPGTYQKLATVELTGTPEVAYEISVNVDLQLSNWGVDGDANYCPLVFTVGGTEIKMGGEIDTIAELETAVENAIKVAIAGTHADDDDLSKEQYNPNTAVPATANSVLVDWKWDFEKDNTWNYQSDEKDTLLGDKVIKATVGFSLTVNVDQVD